MSRSAWIVQQDYRKAHISGFDNHNFGKECCGVASRLFQHFSAAFAINISAF